MPRTPDGSSNPLIVWAVSDGRAGIENQVLGLAEAVARLTPTQIETKHIHYAKAYDRLPSALKLWPDAMLSSKSDRLKPPWPDIWIAAGRATIPHSARMRHRSQGRTLVVQLQDPKFDHHAFDLIIAPQHDHLRGANTLALIGSTHRITPLTLASRIKGASHSIDGLKSPRVAVLIGGRSRAYDLSAERARVLSGQIRQGLTDSGGSLMLTLSRRTPEATKDIFLSDLKDLPGQIFTGDGENPYFAFLHAADHILVTEDSVNMATEAAATGKPVHILAMDHLKHGDKFDNFHRSLRERGITRPYNGRLDTWTYTPLDETQRAAQHVLRVFARKFGRAVLSG